MIGTDILAIKRMRQLYENYPARLVTKILHESEYSDFQLAKDKARFLAKRWAAKEAISKAIGTGLRTPIVMPAIALAHNHAGAPQVLFNHSAQAFLQDKGIKKVYVSLSDEKDYVLAFALVS